MPEKVHAPFTPEQVASLNAYQVADVMHPFTCGANDCHGIRLVAAEDGWHCASQTCGYQQDWAHAFMADWSWRVSDQNLHEWTLLVDRDARGWPARVLVRCACGYASWWDIDAKITMSELAFWRVAHREQMARRGQ